MKRVLVALVAGFLVIGACSSDDSGSGSTTTSEATEADTLAFDDWVDEVNDLCADYGEQVDDLGEPEDFEELSELAPDVIELREMQLEEINDLGMPDENADEVEDLMGVFDDQLGVLEDVVDADGDEEEILDILADNEKIGEEMNELADELGLDECMGDESSTTSTTSDDTTDTTLSADGGLSDLLANELAGIGLTDEESSCVSDGMLDKYSITEMAELDSSDPAVQEDILDIMLSCVSAERIVELGVGG